MQQYADIYLLRNHSTCFGCPSHPSSGVHKTELQLLVQVIVSEQQPSSNVANGTCQTVAATCRGCSYSVMYYWWWVRWTPETCRV